MTTRLPHTGAVYAVLLNGRWHVASKVRASSYGNKRLLSDMRLHPNQYVFGECDTTAFLCAVDEADKVVRLQ